jgi:hypothetical protein
MINRTIVGGRPPGRNAPCPCGSGLRFKKCHGDPVKLCKAAEQADTLYEAAQIVNNLVIKQKYDKISKEK